MDIGSMLLIGGAALCFTLAFVCVLLLASSSKRDDAYESMIELEAPVNTWREDFASWKSGYITLDQFLDRRWDFRQSK